MAFVMYAVMATVFGYLNLPAVGTLFLIAAPVIAFYLSYGFSPACVPMIPTCLLQDVIDVVQIIAPAKLIWPNTLQYYYRCLGPTWIERDAAASNGTSLPQATPHPDFPNIRPGTSDCLRSCRAEQFYFCSWES